MEERCVCCGAIIPEGRQVCPNREANRLDMEIAAANAAGMSYGKWKAMQEPVQVKKELPEGWKVCERCGKAFKPAHSGTRQRFCEVYCQKMAQAEKRRPKSNEYMREWRKQKKEEEMKGG